MTDALEVRKKRLADINDVDILVPSEVMPPPGELINEGPVSGQDVAKSIKISKFKTLSYPEDDPKYVKKVYQDVADMVANAEGPVLSAGEMMFTQLRFRDQGRVREEKVVREGVQPDDGKEDNYQEESYDIKRGIVAVGFRGSGPINPEHLLPNPDLDGSDLVDVGKQLIGRYESIEEMHVIVAGKLSVPVLEKPVETAQIAQPEAVAAQPQAAATVSNIDSPFIAKIDPAEDISFAPGWDQDRQN